MIFSKVASAPPERGADQPLLRRRRAKRCSARRSRSRPIRARSASTTPSSRAIIDDAYDAAGIHPDDIDTGVVILTGEALRRENAQAIAGLLAEQGGDFV